MIRCFNWLTSCHQAANSVIFLLLLIDKLRLILPSLCQFYIELIKRLLLAEPKHTIMCCNYLHKLKLIQLSDNCGYNMCTAHCLTIYGQIRRYARATIKCLFMYNSRSLEAQLKWMAGWYLSFVTYVGEVQQTGSPSVKHSVTRG